MDNIIKLVFLIIILCMFVFCYHSISNNNKFNNIDEKYAIIEKYLIKDSSIAQSNKPLLWIHVDFKLNSRQWLDFGSRNTNNLNMPFIYLTIKSIIDKCGKSFNICLIDDSTFERLIPGWNIELDYIGDPVKNHIRELALCKLLHLYGGIIIPKSFICLKDLFPLYQKNLFVGEFLFHSNTLPCSKLIGCEKNNEYIKKYIEYLEIINSTDFTKSYDFIEKNRMWIIEESKLNNITTIDGKLIGTKDKNNKIITIDRLISEIPIIFDENIYGIYINDEELLKRNKYNWFCRMSPEQVLSSNTTIGTYLLESQT